MTDITIPRELLRQALQAHRALRDWIKAVPDDIQLPAMPGVDGDWLDDVESELRAALEQPAVEPVHPRHPVVVHWGNSGIEACAEIAEAYGNADAARDMRALITAAPQAQEKP